MAKQRSRTPEPAKRKNRAKAQERQARLRTEAQKAAREGQGSNAPETTVVLSNVRSYLRSMGALIKRNQVAAEQVDATMRFAGELRDNKSQKAYVRIRGAQTALDAAKHIASTTLEVYKLERDELRETGQSATTAPPTSDGEGQTVIKVTIA